MATSREESERAETAVSAVTAPIVGQELEVHTSSMATADSRETESATENSDAGGSNTGTDGSESTESSDGESTMSNSSSTGHNFPILLVRLVKNFY